MSALTASDLALLRNIEVVNFVLPILAICVTIFRLCERVINHRFWWDDAWAAVTMIAELGFMISVELDYVENRDHFSKASKIAVYYLCAQLFYVVAWSAKMTILFTIIRVSPLGRLRRILVVIAALFGATWVVLFSQVWWVCEGNTSWKELSIPECDLGRNVAVAQMISDVISDAILIVAPIRLVWRVKLTRARKLRVIAIFSATTLSTAVSLNHASWVLRGDALRQSLAGVIQGSVTLIVANLNVIVAFAFRLGADDKDASPAPLDVKSIVTFGKGDPRRKRSRPGGNALNTTLFTTRTDDIPPSTTIMLQTMNGDLMERGEVSSKYIDRGGEVNYDESTENIQKTMLEGRQYI